MNKLRHVVGGLIIFVAMISLFMNIYDGTKTSYEFTETDLNDEGKNIMTELSELDIIKGISTFVDSISSLLNPTNPLDVLGSLVSAVIGALQTIWGLIAFIPQIAGIITDYYIGEVPGLVVEYLVLLVEAYVAFLIISTKAGKDA